MIVNAKIGRKVELNMKTLQNIISESVQTGNKEWGTLLNKTLDSYCGDNNEIYVKNESIFMYWFSCDNFEKIPSIKELIGRVKHHYEDEHYTQYPGDKLRLYVLNELYSSIKETDSINSFIDLLKELSE